MMVGEATVVALADTEPVVVLMRIPDPTTEAEPAIAPEAGLTREAAA